MMVQELVTYLHQHTHMGANDRELPCCSNGKEGKNDEDNPAAAAGRKDTMAPMVGAQASVERRW